jgi:hypothetical protein
MTVTPDTQGKMMDKGILEYWCRILQKILYYYTVITCQE